MSAAMLAIGLGGNLILWKTGTFSYLADAGIREASYGFLQWLGFVANLLYLALAVSAIEVIGKRSTDPLIRSVFWLSIVLTVGFGTISGTKSGPIGPLLSLVLVYGFTRGRIPRIAFIIPLLLIVIYPFMGAYRENLNSGYRDDTRTADGLASVLGRSFEDAFVARQPAQENAGGTFEQTTSRLSLLLVVHDVISIPDPSQINGDEKVWLAPIYPLIPRFLWSGKPLYNKGQRVSVATGHPSTSASAITPIADFYVVYGTYGVPIGMLVYGVCFQLFMNWLGRRGVSEGGLFIYLTMAWVLTNLEQGIVGFIGGAVQNFVVVLSISYVIYGLPVSSLRSAKYSVSKVAV
jgi:hypothetical protein